MVTITDFKKLVELVDNYEKHLEIEYSANKENFDYKKYNALMFQVSNAYELLVKGLKREF